MKKYVSMLALLSIMVLSQVSYADTACESDTGSDAIDEPVFPKNTIEVKRWDNKQKRYRAILKNGEMVFVTYAYCMHMGMEASLILTNGEVDPGVIAKRADWLASVLLNKEDLLIFRKGIKGKTLTVGATNLEVETSNYDSFSLAVSGYGELTIITIGYYYAL